MYFQDLPVPECSSHASDPLEPARPPTSPLVNGGARDAGYSSNLFGWPWMCVTCAQDVHSMCYHVHKFYYTLAAGPCRVWGKRKWNRNKQSPGEAGL